MEQRVRTSQLHINSASRFQATAISALDIIHGVIDGTIGSHVRVIKENQHATVNTVPPKQSVAKNAIAIYSSIFHRFTNVVLTGEKYPFALSLLNEKLWVFPSNRILMTASMMDHQRDTSRHQLIDYQNGRLKSYDELAGVFGHNYKTKVRLNRIQERLALANQEQRCVARIGLAKHAHNCFVMLFIINTGINLAQLIELPELDTYEVSREHQKFRLIKYRANNKTVEFFITSTFLPVFDKYPALRKYLLGNDVIPYLFFNRSVTGQSKGVITPLSQGWSHRFYRGMKSLLGSDAPNVSAQQWRAYKQDYLIRVTDLATTSILQQHSINTAKKHYLNGTEVTAGQEISNYFELINRIVFAKKSYQQNELIPIGKCENINHPCTDDNLPSTIKADCLTSEGCLFCKNLAVHADEIDIRKLCSFRYLILETKGLSQSEYHFNSVFGEVLKRINIILSTISEKSTSLHDLVDRVSTDVNDNENLDCYWETKLNFLLEIGLI